MLLCYNGVMTIRSSNDKLIQVDKRDLELISIHPWTVASDGYAKKYFEKWTDGTRKRWVIHMHRLIMGANKGELVDHINGDKLDNRRSNLRFASRSLNALNSNKHRGEIPYRGVIKYKNRFRARITLHGKQIHLGTFNTAIEASKAYLTKQKELI